jgi:hypothetical protein
MLQKAKPNRKSQSALEYMMTYGWAILIIVIVAGVLYSLGIFTPSSSTGTTITDFSGLGVTTAACVNSINNQLLELSITNAVGYNVNITAINVTGNNGISIKQVVNTLLSSGQSATFYVNGACNGSTSTYGGSAIITYTEPGQTLVGPYFSEGQISRVQTISNPNVVANFTKTGEISSNTGGYAFPFTIAMWIKVANYPPSDLMGITYFNNGGWDQLFVAYAGYCSGSATGALAIWNPPGPLCDGVISLHKWTFVAVVATSSGFSLEINNTAIVQGGTTSTPTQGTGWSIGQGHFGFNGSMMNVQVYSGALSAAQLNKLYAEGKGGAPIPNAGLIDWWPLDGNANDYSGNNNNGVATNVNWVSP